MTQTAIQNMEQRAVEKPRKTVQDLIKQMLPEIRKALPATITPERFTRIVLSAISTTPQLAACTPKALTTCRRSRRSWTKEGTAWTRYAGR